MSVTCYTGGCLCGAVRYQATGAVRHLCCCHCESCRRAAGAPGVPWGTFDRASFRVTRGTLAQFASSPRVTRGFCAACGTSLTYRHSDRDGDVDVTLASLDQAAQLAPQMHIWVADKLPWVVIGDGQPQYATVPLPEP